MEEGEELAQSADEGCERTCTSQVGFISLTCSNRIRQTPGGWFAVESGCLCCGLANRPGIVGLGMERCKEQKPAAPRGEAAAALLAFFL